jgi:hypothetical protein
MSCEGVKCMHCGANVVPAERFCESCGSILRAIRRAALPEPTTALEAPCADCGNETYVDDYCAACGNRAPSPRATVDLDGIVLITDRGLEHPATRTRPQRGSSPARRGAAACDGRASATGSPLLLMPAAG